MLKNKYVIKALILIGAILCNSATAQELDIPKAHYPKLPKYAATAKGFVPPGWTLEIKKSGDLNGDGRPDLLLVLHENNPKNIIEHDEFGMIPLDTNPRILAVVFAKPGGGYTLAMQNHTVIERHVDHTLSDVLEGSGASIVRKVRWTLTIAHGILRVKVNSFANAGSPMAGTKSYTFRYQGGDFKLIGYDSNFLDQRSAETEKISVNYLTGKIKKERGNGVDDNQDEVRWEKLSSLKPIPIADVDGTTFEPDLN